MKGCLSQATDGPACMNLLYQDAVPAPEAGLMCSTVIGRRSLVSGEASQVHKLEMEQDNHPASFMSLSVV